MYSRIFVLTMITDGQRVFNGCTPGHWSHSRYGQPETLLFHPGNNRKWQTCASHPLSFDTATERLIHCFLFSGIASLCRRFEPSFDQSKLCIKVPSTWEGLQACSKLKSLGIQTLATTLFTLEQAILAAEVGCIYVSPFLHELKALLDET